MSEEPVVEKTVEAESEEDESSEVVASSDQLKALVEALANGPAFGPPFFQGELGEMVRKETPEGHVPRVRMHLAGGDILDVTRVLGITPRWVALRTAEENDGDAATEIIPYGSIHRVTLTSVPPDSNRPRIGFRQERALARVPAGAPPPAAASSPLTAAPAVEEPPK